MCELPAESVYNNMRVGNTVVLGHDDKHEIAVRAPVAKVPTGVSKSLLAHIMAQTSSGNILRFFNYFL
jgi:hypothetical protein